MNLRTELRRIKQTIPYSVVLILATAFILFASCDDDDNDGYVQPLKGVNVSVNTTLGKILVDENGKTLYFFSNDFGATSTCEGGCVTNWPVFYKESITIGEGLDMADFNEITRADGAKQTTYKGWPLYRYAADAAAGSTSGDKVNNVWYVAKPDYTVMVGKKDGVKYLVAPKGKTIYTFAQDGNNTSACTSETCVTNWPVFFNDANGVPSILAKTDFGSFNRADGSRQLAYKNQPLYYFKNDLVRGDINGQGLADGAWLKVDEARF